MNKRFIVLLLDLFVTFKRCRMSCQDIFLYTIHTETALLKRNSYCCLVHYGDQASPAPCECASAPVWKISPSHPNKQIKLVHLINTMSYMLPRAVGLISPEFSKLGKLIMVIISLTVDNYLISVRSVPWHQLAGWLTRVTFNHALINNRACTDFHSKSLNLGFSNF